MNLTNTSTMLMAIPRAVVRIPLTEGWTSLLCMPPLLFYGISVIEPVGLDIMRKIQQPGMGKMHRDKQLKGRADIGAMDKRAAAAIDHDLTVPVHCRQK